MAEHTVFNRPVRCLCKAMEAKALRWRWTGRMWGHCGGDVDSVAILTSPPPLGALSTSTIAICLKTRNYTRHHRYLDQTYSIGIAISHHVHLHLNPCTHPLSGRNHGRSRQPQRLCSSPHSPFLLSPVPIPQLTNFRLRTRPQQPPSSVRPRKSPPENSAANPAQAPSPSPRNSISWGSG